MSKSKTKHAGGRPRIVNRSRLLEYKVEVNFTESQLASIDAAKGILSRAQYIRAHVFGLLNASNVITKLPQESSLLPRGLNDCAVTDSVSKRVLASI